MKGESMDTDPEGLAQMAEALKNAMCRCIEEFGFQFPLHTASVSRDGKFLVIRNNAPGEDGEILADGMPDGVVMGLPVNVMITDREGRSAVATLDRTGHMEWSKSEWGGH